MTTIDLYIDTQGRTLVSGTGNATPYALPGLVQGDTVRLRVWLLERNQTYPLYAPFTVTSPLGMTLRVGIGIKDGAPGSPLIAAQFAFAVVGDHFEGALSLATAGVSAAIGTAESAQRWFEVEVSQSGTDRTTVLQKPVRIEAEVIEDAALVPVPHPVCVTRDEVAAMLTGAGQLTFRHTAFTIPSGATPVREVAVPLENAFLTLTLPGTQPLRLAVTGGVNVGQGGGLSDGSVVKMATVRLVAQGAFLLSFQTGIRFVGCPPPSALAEGDVLLVTLASYGPSVTDTIATVVK